MSEKKNISLSVDFADAEYHSVHFEKYDFQRLGETVFIVGSGGRSEGLENVSENTEGGVRNSALMSIVNLWESISVDCQFNAPNYTALAENEECRKHIVKWCAKYGMPYIISNGSRYEPVNEFVDPEINQMAVISSYWNRAADCDDLSISAQKILRDGCDLISFLQDCRVIHDRFMAWYESEEGISHDSDLLSRFQFAGTAMYSVKITSGKPILKLVFRSIIELAKMQLLCVAVLNTREGNNFVHVCDMCGKLFMGRKNQKVCYDPCHRRDKGKNTPATSEEDSRPVKDIVVKRTTRRKESRE